VFTEWDTGWSSHNSRKRQTSSCNMVKGFMIENR